MVMDRSHTENTFSACFLKISDLNDNRQNLHEVNQSNDQYCVVGYKGQSAFDAGMFYCPYIPLQLVRAQDPNTFQPKIGFKTRYGLVANPMVQLDAGLGATGNLPLEQLKDKNYYFSKFVIRNL